MRGTIMEDKSCCRSIKYEQENYMTLEPRNINFRLEIVTTEEEEDSESREADDASHAPK